MSIEEIRHLLSHYKINPNKLLGQNFMIDNAFYPKLYHYTEIIGSDVVLDLGAGFGFLACYLYDKCQSVIAVEKDPQVAEALRTQVKNFNNVFVVEGDFLKVKLPVFNKIIAIPPYYLSSKLITWLLKQNFDSATMILQKEFANRLVAQVGAEEYGWLTVLAQQKIKVNLLDSVPKDVFYPQPEVDSIILKLEPLDNVLYEIKDIPFFIKLIKWLFTQRNKKLAKAIMPFIKNNYKLSKQDAEKMALNLPYCDKRIRELWPKHFGAIASALLD